MKNTSSAPIASARANESCSTVCDPKGPEYQSSVGAKGMPASTTASALAATRHSAPRSGGPLQTADTRGSVP